MRKSGFAAAAGIGSLALLLTACGGSSGSSSGTSTPASTSTSTSTANPAASPSSALGVTPGSTVLHVQKSALGYVLAMGNGQVLYTYDKDTKGSAPACTGSCADTWIPVAGKKPAISPADTGLGTLGTVANGSVTQITYNGLPLYMYKGAKALTTAGNGVGGAWHVVKLSASNIVGGA
jgi:predicted lipoprotein with Yx(FWY)xxD motif